MSESDAAGHVRAPLTSSAPGVPPVPRPEPQALLVLDRTTGRVAAGSPAGRRRLAGFEGERLGYWLTAVATAAGHRDGAVVRTWFDDEARAERARTGAIAARPLRITSVPITFRSRPCLLVVLRDDATAPAPLPPEAHAGLPAAEPGCAVFTLDAIGRVDSWGTTPQRITGYRPEHMIGGDATPLHPAAARLAGDHHKALTTAYRSGEHRVEGWRLCSDGRLIWAEVTTMPLYDAFEALLGFAQVVHDLTPVRRLHHHHRTTSGTPDDAHQASSLPSPRASAAPPAGGPARGARRPAGRIPTQRRP